MDLATIIAELDLHILTDQNDFSNTTPTGGYAADLLSCVMAGAPHGGIWITLQAHIHIVAVAALIELCAVILTDGALPAAEPISKAHD